MKAFPIVFGVLLAAAPAFAQIPDPTPPPGAPPPATEPLPEAPVPFEQPAGQPDAAPPGLGFSAPAAGLQADAQAVVSRVLLEAARAVTAEVDENGTLMVTGVVTLLADKLALHEALTELPAANIVVNRVGINAPRRSDAAIARDVRRRLENDSALRPLGLEVIVRDQAVYLRGRAPSGLDIQTAARAAAEIRGVKDVHTERLEASLPYR